MTPQRLNILFVLTPALHPNEGGVQMTTCKLGRRFSEQGHRVSVFSFAQSGHSQGEPMDLFHAKHGAGQRDAKNLQELSTTISEVKPDVVINQMPYEHEIGATLLREKAIWGFLLLGCLRNTLFSVKGNLEAYVSSLAPWPLKRLAASRLVQRPFLEAHRKRHRADLVKILSTYDRFVMFGPPNLEELRYFVPEFAPDKVCLIPNSIPQVLEKVPEKEKRLLWLGRVSHEQKNAELIIPLWRAISSRLPDWEFDVVGDGPLLMELKKQARNLGLERIHFYGRQVPDPYYRRSAIFVMTSSFEGFPNVLVEAQSFAAIPVLFDSYPVASWIVDEGINGFLVPAGDLDAMIERIVQVALNPERERIAGQVLESARRFTIDRVGEQWQELFNKEVPNHIGGERRLTV